MKTFTTEEKTTIKRVSRWIKLEWRQVTAKHSMANYADEGMLICFRHNNKLYALGQFDRLAYPIFFENEEGKTSYLSAYDSAVWYKPYLLEVSDCGEYVRLYEEVGKEED